MDKTFLVMFFAIFSESVDGLLVESRITIALLGERINLVCMTNNSSYPANWFFKPQGSSNSKRLDCDSQACSDISLVIDPVRTTHAGRYDCVQIQYTLQLEVVVLAPSPSCDESAMFPSRSVVCSFHYAGNLAPVLEWLKLGNTSWNASCSASNGTVDCTFENSCTASPNVTTPIHKIVPQSEICREDSYICKWATGDVSSNVGILEVKDQNRTNILGGWQCNPTEFSTTSAIKTIDDISRILIPICAGVITTIMVLLLLICIHKKYGRPVCRMTRKSPDVHFETATEEELYEEIDLPKKEVVVQTQTGFIMKEIEKEDPALAQMDLTVEGIHKEVPVYAKPIKPKKEDPTETQTGSIEDGMHKAEDLYGVVNKPKRGSVYKVVKDANHL